MGYFNISTPTGNYEYKGWGARKVLQQILSNADDEETAPSHKPRHVIGFTREEPQDDASAS